MSTKKVPVKPVAQAKVNKAPVKPAHKAEVKPAAKVELKAAPKPDLKAVPKSDIKLVHKSDAKPVIKVEPKLVAGTNAKPAAVAPVAAKIVPKPEKKKPDFRTNDWVVYPAHGVGRIIQVNQIVVNSAREGARLAAGAYVNGTPVTSPMVTQAVRDYMQASGLPAAAYNGATITLTCLASPTWVNPSDALPLDRFQVTVTIPTGAAFNSMLWSLVYRLSSVNQMSVTVNWVSCTDAKIAISTVLPY